MCRQYRAKARDLSLYGLKYTFYPEALQNLVFLALLLAFRTIDLLIAEVRTMLTLVYRLC